MIVDRFGSPIIQKLAAFLVFLCVSSAAQADIFNHPWKNAKQALVIDAYEKNPINWRQLSEHKAVRGFIGKASDGLPPPWACTRKNKTELTLCKKTFQNYWLKRELYHTRRMMAKSIGLKWGAYHLGRPGNPIDQANHFLSFAEPEADDLIALDIEHDDPEKWISFKDAEIFARHIHFRTGRYPVLYTNHDTAKRIAAQSDKYPLLSRLKLWYARFRGDIRGVFPLGNWESYSLWQFSARANCTKRRCLYRVKGTQPDIDVNATGLSFAEFDKQWPFDGLEPQRVKPGSQSDVLMVSHKTPEPEPVVRYKMALKFDVSRGKTIRVSSIAVPTPRIRENVEPVGADPILTASVEPNVVAGVSPKTTLKKPSEPVQTFPSILAELKSESTSQANEVQAYMAAMEVVEAAAETLHKPVSYAYTNAAKVRNRKDHVADRYRY